MLTVSINEKYLLGDFCCRFDGTTCIVHVVYCVN